jgi:uncharacterized protein YbjT (DUF2867 family)
MSSTSGRTRILITSGNSKIGYETLKALVKLGETNVCVGTRDPGKWKQELLEAGAKDVVELDLYKLDTIKTAMKGVERVLLVAGLPSPHPDDMKTWTKNFVEAAKATPTVKLLCRVSAIIADQKAEWTGKLHWECDEYLVKSGYEYVLFRPTFFITNIVNEGYVKNGEVPSASGNGRTAYVALEDVGECIAQVLHNPKKFGTNRPFVMTGSKAITDEEVVNLINKYCGTQLKLKQCTSEEFKQCLKKFAIPPELANHFAYFDELRRNNAAAGTKSDLDAVLGRQAMTPEKWISDHAQDFAQYKSA